MGTRISPAPSQWPKPLYNDELTAAYFQRLEAEGHDVRPYEWMLRAPGTTPLKTLATMATELDVELIDLLQAGLGVYNSFDEIDRAISRSGEGNRLGVVQHIA